MLNLDHANRESTIFLEEILLIIAPAMNAKIITNFKNVMNVLMENILSIYLRITTLIWSVRVAIYLKQSAATVIQSST
jgi:hypothetical protein